MVTTSLRAPLAARHQATLRWTLTDTAAANGSRPTWTVLELEAEHLGRPAPCRFDCRVVGLRQQHHAPVVAEVGVAQLGMAVESERAPHQRIEVLGEEVGEVEGAGLRLVQRREQLGPGHELVAVVAGQARRTLADLVEQQVEVTAGAAVAVAEHERPLAVVVDRQLLTDGGDDPLRPAVVRRRAGTECRPCRSARVGRARRADRWRAHRRRSGAASPRWRQLRTEGPGGSATRRLRRAWTSSLAVSAATAASRQ